MKTPAALPSRWIATAFLLSVAASSTASGQACAPVPLVPTGGAFTDRGPAVGISGDTVVVTADIDKVGDNVNQGSARVYRRIGGAWVEEAKLTALDGAELDSMGSHVAIEGDTILIGAHYATIGTHAQQGAAYVFHRSGNTWTQQAKLYLPEGEQQDLFGFDVDISHDTAVISCHRSKVNGQPSGAAYVFTRSGETWTRQARLTASDAAPADFFSYSVAIDGDTIAVGSESADIDGVQKGAVYIFTRFGGAWTQQAKLIAPDGLANEDFGYAVDLDGQTLAVTSQLNQHGRGAAYVFVGAGSKWTQQAKLVPSEYSGTEYFGDDVELHGDTLVVGASWINVNNRLNQGLAFPFIRSGDIWLPRPALAAPKAGAYDFFGKHVAISDDYIVCGAQLTTVGTSRVQGGAWIFPQTGSFWGCPPCAADLDGNGNVDLGDFFEFFNCFDATAPCADIDGSGVVDLGDFFSFFNHFDASC